MPPSSRDPLETVLRLRRVTVDDAKRGLAAAMAAAEVAQRRTIEAERAIAREAEAASDLALGDAAVESFAAWLPVGRAQAAVAQHASTTAEATVMCQRAAVAAARSAAEAGAALLDRRKQARLLLAGRHDQAALDEMAARVREPFG